MPVVKHSVTDYTKSFSSFGMEFSKNGSANLKSTCHLCDKPDHFYMNPITGQWDCKHCLQKGNHYTFLSQYFALCRASTVNEDLIRLSGQRHGIPETFFDTEQGIPCAFDSPNNRWLIPTSNVTDYSSLTNLYHWSGPGSKCLSTANCSLHLFREEALRTAPIGLPAFICEGPWDTIALCWLQSILKFLGVIVGVPGAGTFKDYWKDLFKGRNVTLLYDNDKAGQEGMSRAAKILHGSSNTIRYIQWPVEVVPGFDIGDAITGALCGENKPTKTNATSVWKHLQSCLVTVGATTNTTSLPTSLATSVDTLLDDLPVTTVRKHKPVKFSQLIAAWKKSFYLDKNMIDAIQVVLATIVSVRLANDPLWVFLIGPPGCGKTAALLNLAKSELVKYESSLTPHNLISGFRTPDGTNASLLPQWNRKCVVLKDYTEIVSMPKQMQEEIYKTLRGAYDGQVDITFGNQVRCQYSDLYFSLVAGVTDIIHGDDRATLGERFLKFEFLRNTHRTGYLSTEEQVKRAVRNLDSEEVSLSHLKHLVADFIWTIENSILPPENLRLVEGEEPNEILVRKRSAWLKQHIPRLAAREEDRIIALAQIVAYLRAGVNRHRDGDITYRARPEVATRLAKQMAKLGKSLALLHGKRTVDEECYRLVERTAMDTAIAWNVDIISLLIKKKNKAQTIVDFSQELQIPRNTIQRRLDNLQELRALIKERLPQPVDPLTGKKMPGQPPFGYKATPQLLDLWKRARISV